MNERASYEPAAAGQLAQEEEDEELDRIIRYTKKNIRDKSFDKSKEV